MVESKRRKKREEDEAVRERQLSKELEDSFPASDPPASTQPGSGITGAEAAKPKEKASKSEPVDK